MWFWGDGEDQATPFDIPIDAPSSTGEFDDLRQEVAVYWTAIERGGATGDWSELDYFSGAFLIVDSDGNVRNTDDMEHDSEGSILLDPGDRVVTWQLDPDVIEDNFEAVSEDLEDFYAGE
jgi:hypothetical protein